MQPNLEMRPTLFLMPDDFTCQGESCTLMG
jgi:hypothetical protein